jgi:hypothetical protein
MKEEALKLADEFKDRQGWTHVDAVEWCVKSSAMIRRLVEELDKQGKPKAWIREDGVIAFFKQKEIDDQGFKWQPLYLAPQTKPLSDEEIKNLHEQTSWWGISDPVKFARAIEERHGIK